MAATTLYDVMIRFGVKDKKAKRGILGLGSASDKAYQAMKRVAVVAGAGLGFSSLVKHTVGFNRELANTQNSLATVIQMMDKDTNTREAGMTKSSMLMKQLREDAKQSAGTFQDMTGFSREIAAAVFKAGGSMEDLRTFTKGGVVAAAALGEKAQVASLDIKQALAGTVGKRDPFASKLLASVNMTTDAFNELDSAARMKTLQKAFNQKAIKDAAKSYQNNFEGVFSTFKSTLQEFGGKVGSKLFAKLTKSLQAANKWFEQNSAKVEMFADRIADGMVTAFNVAKDIFGFLFEHRDLLMTLAKAMLIAKAGKIMAGPFMAFNERLGGSTLALKDNVKGLKGFGAALGPAIQALTAGFAIGTALDDALGLSDKISDALAGTGGGVSIKGQRTGDAVADSIANKKAMAKAIRKKFSQRLEVARRFKGNDAMAKRFGVMTEADIREKYKVDQLYAAKLEKQANSIEMFAKLLQTSDLVKIRNAQKGILSPEDAERLKQSMLQAVMPLAESIKNPFMDLANALGFGPKKIPGSTDKDTAKNKGGRQTINVHMEVASDDPDRFVIDLENYFERANTNPSQAANPMRR